MVSEGESLKWCMCDGEYVVRVNSGEVVVRFYSMKRPYREDANAQYTVETELTYAARSILCAMVLKTLFKVIKNLLACWSGIPNVWHLAYLVMCPLKNNHLMDG